MYNCYSFCFQKNDAWLFVSANIIIFKFSLYELKYKFYIFILKIISLDIWSMLLKLYPKKLNVIYLRTEGVVQRFHIIQY